MDEIDRRLLALLQDDATLSIAQAADCRRANEECDLAVCDGADETHDCLPIA
jgi:hypothetical protein